MTPSGLDVKDLGQLKKNPDLYFNDSNSSRPFRFRFLLRLSQFDSDSDSDSSKLLQFRFRFQLQLSQFDSDSDSYSSTTFDSDSDSNTTFDSKVVLGLIPIGFAKAMIMYTNRRYYGMN